MFEIDISEEKLGNNPEARKSLFDEKDADALEEIQDIRAGLTNLLTRDEEGKLRVPDKTSDKVLLAQLLDGRERLIMTKTRLKSIEKEAESAGNLADVVAKALHSFKAVSKPATASEREIPAEYLAIQDVPGEMEIGNLPLSIEKINPGE